MATLPAYGPSIPYLGQIPGGMRHGTMLRIKGQMNHGANRFVINIQTGAATNPRDDCNLHLSVRPAEQAIVRNTLQNQIWGTEERYGNCPIYPGGAFELIILAEHSGYKIAVNSAHHSQFNHRVPLNTARYISVHGECTIQSITLEQDGPPIGGVPTPFQPIQPIFPRPPHLGGGGGPGYPGGSINYPTIGTPPPPPPPPHFVPPPHHHVPPYPGHRHPYIQPNNLGEASGEYIERRRAYDASNPAALSYTSSAPTMNPYNNHVPNYPIPTNAYPGYNNSNNNNMRPPIGLVASSTTSHLTSSPATNAYSSGGYPGQYNGWNPHQPPSTTPPPSYYGNYNAYQETPEQTKRKKRNKAIKYAAAGVGGLGIGALVFSKALSKKSSSSSSDSD